MFEDKTPETIKNEILKALPLWSTQSGSFANTIVSAAAYEIWQCYMAMNALIPMFYIDETSGEYIDKKCAEYGITRKEGAKAKVMLTFTGNTGLTIPAKSVFMTSDGLAFLTDSAVTLINGTANVKATAEKIGSSYNVPSGTVVSSKFIIGGLLSTTNNTAAVGGIDEESDSALVARFYTYIKTPPTSGNAYHYKAWALEVTGVGAAKVISLWNGPGTVKVLLSGNDGRAVSSDVVLAAAQHIEKERPIGAAVTVEGASELHVNVSAAITIDSSTTKSIVKAKFESALKEYLSLLIFTTYTINYNRISYLLLSIPGVVDYSALTINNGTINIAVGDSQIPVLGTLEVT